MKHLLSWELVGMLLVMGLLVFLANPLTAPSFNQGLGQRYATGVAALANPKNAQVSWLLAHLQQVLMVHGLALWLALRIGRSHLPAVARSVCTAAVWALVAAWQQQHLGSGLAQAMVLALVGIGLLAVLGSKRRVAQRSTQVPVHALALAGWYAFTGLGTIWLLDYSAGTYPGLRYIGLGHANEVVAAHFVFTWVAAHATFLSGALARLLAYWDRASLSAEQRSTTHAGGATKVPLALHLPLLYVLWAALVVGLHYLLGKNHSATTAELLRIPFYFLGGWALFRWAGTGDSQRALGLWAAIGMAIALGLVLTFDFGPLLLLLLCVALLGGVWVARVGQGRRPALIAGAAVALLTCIAGLFAISTLAYLAPSHIGQRESALHSLFTGKLVYLSQLRWLAADTPWAGYGLTQVPWCGTYASLDPVHFSCDRYKAASLPWEMHSDFVFAGLAAVWGAPLALLIVMALALWFISLLRGTRQADPAHPDGFRYWVFLLFTCVMLAQIFFSAMGSVGLVVVTGVTVPLLGHGLSMLLSCALFCGLALHRTVAAFPQSFHR